MMLHSRARCLTCISRRLPHALIVTAGLSVAGCGGRFFETPSALSRSVSAPTSEETAGRATLEDPPSESSTGVRAGARRFLATLFRRNTESNEPLRDPFLDTPVFAHVETAETPVGVAHTADGETATANVAPSRRIVRPPRRSDPTPQPEIEEAAARLAAAATRTQREVPNSELPEWAIPSHQNGTIPQLTQEPGQTSPWAQEQTRVAVSEGRVRIGRLQSQPPRTETAPEPSRKIESLLAARSAAAPRREPPAAAQPQARAQESVANEWPGVPAVARRAARFAPPAAAAARRNTELPPWAVAAREQPSPDTVREVRDTIREVRDLPTHFDNVLALAESPAPEPVRRSGTGVATASAGTPTRWEPAAISSAANISHEDDDPDWPESATESPFPVLNEWRGVGANTPVTVADAGDWDVRAEFDIHQTAFEEDSQEDGLRSAGFDVPGGPEAATIAPAPPVEANSGIRAFGAAASEQEESGSPLPWFVALLVAIGLGIVVYRLQWQRGKS